MYEKNWCLCPLAVKQGGIFCLSSSKKQRKPWFLVRKNVPLQSKSNTTNMKRIKMPLLAKVKTPLLARIIIAIILGVVFGNFFNEAAVRAFLTFNGIFSQFLGFMNRSSSLVSLHQPLPTSVMEPENSSLPPWASPLPIPSWRVCLPMVQVRLFFHT